MTDVFEVDRGKKKHGGCNKAPLSFYVCHMHNMCEKGAWLPLHRCGSCHRPVNTFVAHITGFSECSDTGFATWLNVYNLSPHFENKYYSYCQYLTKLNQGN